MKKKSRKELTVDQQIKRRTFLSFFVFGALGFSAFEGWKWLYNSPEETAGITGGVHKPLRRALNKTEIFFRRLSFNENHLVKTYPKSMAARNVRHNSDIGSDSAIDTNAWRMEVKRNVGTNLLIDMNAIKALPKTEIVYDFKCVEGWDQVQYWGGVKLADFVAHFGLQEDAKKQYVGLETPDGRYYVGLDRESALHPQTILAYEMNNQPLPLNHGAPLRLIIPVKYGIKNLKRIGSIRFSDTRPRDYWAERGYDYYSGL